MDRGIGTASGTSTALVRTGATGSLAAFEAQDIFACVVNNLPPEIVSLVGGGIGAANLGGGMAANIVGKWIGPARVKGNPAPVE